MNIEVAKKLDETLSQVLPNDDSSPLTGFKKAYIIATAIENLNIALTDEYMKPVMSLQGKSIGFRTDKDKDGGYPMQVVKSCLIEAVLMGLEPTGNQFNIIAGRTYVTKEGFFALLKTRAHGVTYQIIHEVVQFSVEKKSALVNATITWSLNNVEKKSVVPIPIKMDAYTSVDAVIGKATRKARAWLYERITGNEVPDGEVDGNVIPVTGTSEPKEDKEKLRLIKLINQAQSVDVLMGYKSEVDKMNDPEVTELYKQKSAQY